MKIDEKKFRDVKELDEHTAVGYLKTSEAIISKNNVRAQNQKVDLMTDVTLGRSIKEFGLANLPLCTPNGEIVCGSRRLRAMKDQEWILVLIKDNLNESQQIELSLHENWARTNLPVEDEINSIIKYIKTNPSLTMPEIAKKLQVPLTWLTDRLQIQKNVIPLLNGQKIVRTEGLSKGQEKMSLTLSKATVLARDWIPKEVREHFIEKIKTEGMGKEQLQRKIGAWKVVQTVIDEEEDPEIKKKLEEKYDGVKGLDVDPKTVLNEWKRLHGQIEYSCEDIELPIEFFETDKLKADVKIPDDLKNRIDVFFLTFHGKAPSFKLVMKGQLPPKEIERIKKSKENSEDLVDEMLGIKEIKAKSKEV